MSTITLRDHLDLAATRALGDCDASPYSVTAGCFDRRYWAWKLVDFPEATFQRLVYPLAMLYRDPGSRYHDSPEVLAAVRAGLACAGRLQHANGSFDQAFPFEQSYGATAFLVYPLLEASRLVADRLTAAELLAADRTARRGAEFLCAHEETHGEISNHLAGAALSLFAAADRFGETRYADAGTKIVDGLLARQSPEGWFPEYGGADPGYQTLCLDYLSAIHDRRPSAPLEQALDRAVEFLKWFVHPDGTLGGVYGSRRTSLTYLGGLARMAGRNSAALGIYQAVSTAMAAGDTAGPLHVDAGNLAPMLTSAVSALGQQPAQRPAIELPCRTAGARIDFPSAGLHVRSGRRYYAVCGASNGGTLTVFSRESGRLLLEDGGYVAQTGGGARLTTQAPAQARVDADTIEIDSAFVGMSTAVPTPARFVLLRLLNLTVMRSIAVGNWVKGRLVAMLMRGGAGSDLRLKRRLVFDDQGVQITDRIENPQGQALASLHGGQPFSAIHMASAGYFHGARLGTARPATVVDVERLARDRAVEIDRRV